jgi:glycyl-tRNA synthetase
MEKIVSLMKWRDFIFKLSDIYGGMNGFFDCGRLGVELKRNVKEAWWSDVVKRRNDVVGLDCPIISPNKIWETSGHVAGFSDPMVDCKASKMRFLVDQLFFRNVIVDGESIDYICVQECDDTAEAAETAAEILRKTFKKQKHCKNWKSNQLWKLPMKKEL